jgi:hypothetical protein
VYGASLDLDFTESYRLIRNELRTYKTPVELIEAYVNLRSTFLSLVAMKFKNTEGFLRDLCREAERKDNIKPVGRFTT